MDKNWDTGVRSAALYLNGLEGRTTGNGQASKVLNVESWDKEVDESIDLITCLNLLDRCDTPATLLRTIHRKLAPDGKLVVAIVLPISPYVETGTTDHEPSENLGITGVMIEDQVNSLIGDVFPSFGFNTLRWTRLPYLCEGDMDQAFYWLSDIVFILKKRDEGS
ncbi:Methyltransferase-like protein 9 [Armadillidium nasatum]|uniref:Methyltransferase-like protein 9 n=1 Tax=Armadillidium nasatum TaxID=96803 RepID=A0A5N5SQA2_9CRUS|nr:Methyltransferase-like protein 9 [Armadillidium nasatum]